MKLQVSMSFMSLNWVGQSYAVALYWKLRFQTIKEIGMENVTERKWHFTPTDWLVCTPNHTTCFVHFILCDTFFFFRFVTVCSFVCLCFIVIYFSMRRKVLAFVISFGFFRLKQLLTVGAFIARKMKMWHKKGLIRKFTEKKRANAFNCLVGNQ